VPEVGYVLPAVGGNDDLPVIRKGWVEYLKKSTSFLIGFSR
jgi:hypothetical protein